MACRMGVFCWFEAESTEAVSEVICLSILILAADGIVALAQAAADLHYNAHYHKQLIINNMWTDFVQKLTDKNGSHGVAICWQPRTHTSTLQIATKRASHKPSNRKLSQINVVRMFSIWQNILSCTTDGGKYNN